MLVSPESLQSCLALVLGFAFAGLCASGYQAATQRPVSFRLLEGGPLPSTFAAIPLLAFAAPFIIMRTTLAADRPEHRFQTVMIGTVVAGMWSLMSGTVVVAALHALGF
jgi:Family of unknown function (DUF6949)